MDIHLFIPVSPLKALQEEEKSRGSLGLFSVLLLLSNRKTVGENLSRHVHTISVRSDFVPRSV